MKVDTLHWIANDLMEDKMKEYKATAEKIVLHLQGQYGTEDYLFGKDEVRIFERDGNLWFEYNGKEYESIDSLSTYIKAGFIEEKCRCYYAEHNGKAWVCEQCGAEYSTEDKKNV